MLEKKFLINIHRFNLIKLKDSKDIKNESFTYYFKMIIKESHIFIKCGYYSLMYFCIFYFLLTAIFFIPKTIEFRLFKILMNFLKKFSLCNEVLRFIKIHSLIFEYD